MPSLDLMQTFITVVEKHSFTQAALHLKISKALVSTRIKRLEQDLGLSVLVRDTRKLILTTAGQELYVHFKDLLLSLTQSIENVRQGQLGTSGILRITSTFEFGHQVLWPLLAPFCQTHSELHLHCLFDSKPYDLIREQIDVAIRLGQLVDSSHRAKKLAEYEIVLVASKQHAAQLQLTDLEQLETCHWISNLNLSSQTFWTFYQNGQSHSIHENTKYAANNIQTMKHMLLDHLGIAVIPKWLIETELSQGLLQQLLPEYRLSTQGIYAVFPNQAYVATKTRLLIDHLATTLPQALPAPQ
ncbi:LysR family transcriptional regulator [Acinetobacter calcoaceticus]|uniref:LysR family transcriptional regulator n=1 Tax=Acinetobacter calcoaceticus TaxID=471 RepID=A0A4R1XZV8_ACICA|nr:LysR family transcriptional regulator [Acinetobacter calcoaceticus]